MTPDTMRKIDATLGPVICAALTVRRKLLNLVLPRRTGELTNVKKILFVKPAEMGSTILMYAMLKHARDIWPDCEFHFLVFSENTAAVEMLGLVPDKNVHCISSSDIKSFVKGSLVALYKLRSLKFDVAIDLEFFSRASAILTELSGAKSTCGFSRFTMEGLYKGDFFTHPVQYNAHIHTALSFYSMIDSLVQPKNQIPLSKSNLPKLDKLELARLEYTEDEKTSLFQLIKEVQPATNKKSKLLILNVNSSELVPLRRWPLDRFIELGKKLLKDKSVLIVLTGTKSEINESAHVEAQLGKNRVVNLVGKTSLRQLLVLYAVCGLLVTNDSGPSHFASLTDIPTVTLFGPETPKLYGALGKNKVAITANLACSPCVSSYNHRATMCNDNLCMKAIKVEEVFQKCLELVNLELD